VFDPLGCTPKDAVVVQCKGAFKAREVPAPKLKKLSRLALPKMRKIGCDTNLDQMVTLEDKREQTAYAGDPGSVYLVLCPNHCKDSGAMVTGLGIYTPETSICKAALHMGAIFDDLGGIVQVTVS
jgi:hypothetical protein